MYLMFRVAKRLQHLDSLRSDIFYLKSPPISVSCDFIVVAKCDGTMGRENHSGWSIYHWPPAIPDASLQGRATLGEFWGVHLYQRA